MANEPSPSILTTHPHPSITLLTISRPQARNAINPPTAQELYNAFLTFENDSSQRVLVLTGADNTFCAGYDLKALSQTPSSGSDPNVGPVVPGTQTQAPMGPSRLMLSKPVIAAVAGYAVAGGLELSLLADIRVAEEDAIFGVFCRRWGVPLIDGGTVRLPAIIGLGRAMDMILTGRSVGAQEALSMGLANSVVGKGKAVEEAVALAKRLLEFPQRCMCADRRSVYFAAFEAGGLDEALGFECTEGVKVVEGESIRGAGRFSGGEGRHGSFEGMGKSKL